MDRTGWVIIIFCVLGLVGWEVYVSKQRALAPSPVAATPVPPASLSPASASASATPALTTTAAPPAPSSTATPMGFAERIETLRNKDVELRLTNRGGGINEAVLLNHVASTGGNVTLNGNDRLPIAAIVTEPQSTNLPEFSFARTADGAVQYTQTDAQHVTTRKTFRLPAKPLPKDNFVVNLDVDLTNTGAAPLRLPTAFVTLGNATPQHGNDYPTYTRLAWCINGGAKSIDVNWFAAQNYPLVGVQKRAAQPSYNEAFKAGAEWAGVTNQFFATLVTPLNFQATDIWGQRTESGKNGSVTTYSIEGAMGLPPLDLAPGETKTLKFEIYAGPKLYARLAAMDRNQAEIMNFGLWKLVSQFLLNFMNLLHSWLGNYAVAIVVLTIIIRGVLWPLQNASTKSMRKMQALGPKMQALKEKYKDDPTRMNQEVMKMYKEHGVNPVGGCLPMLLQIPIFFGLLSMLGQAVELRNAKFLWVHDLSQPDTVGHIPGLGWPINILPLFMGAAQFWVMQVSPKSGDATQQKVMMFMPLIFFFFCYNFAAALALYYTTFNLLMVLQLYVNQRTQPLTVPVKTPAKIPSKGKARRR